MIFVIFAKKLSKFLLIVTNIDSQPPKVLGVLILVLLTVLFIFMNYLCTYNTFVFCFSTALQLFSYTRIFSKSLN